MKKAQGLPLNTIIIAAIVLIVLIVLWAIFTGRMGVFSKGLKETTDEKVNCASDLINGVKSEGNDKASATKACNDKGGTVIVGNFGDIDEAKEVCCTK